MRTPIILSTIGLAAAVIAVAGPLNPPAGPITPTYKTLSEVEPRIPVGPTTTPGNATSVYLISAPGTYYLTGPIQGVAAKSGIAITADRVTLDLNGFAITGIAGSLAGINASGSDLTTVRGGIVSGWGTQGVYLGTVCTVEDVIAESCLAKGISVSVGSRVSRCVVRANGDSTSGDSGIETAGDSTQVSSCVSRSNLGSGFGVGGGSGAGMREGCAAGSNTGIGFQGNTSGAGMLATGCVSVGHSTGFSLEDGGALRNCIAANGTYGVFGSFPRNLIEGLATRGHTSHGIHTGNGGIIANCASYLDAQNGTSSGINTLNTTDVQGCIVTSSGGQSITCGSIGRVNGNVVRGGLLNGIWATSQLNVSENLVLLAGGIGILVDGDSARVEANMVHDCVAGINASLASGRVLIIRNSAEGNAIEYVVAAGNLLGTVVATEAAMNAAPNGNVNIDH